MLFSPSMFVLLVSRTCSHLLLRFNFFLSFGPPQVMKCLSAVRDQTDIGWTKDWPGLRASLSHVVNFIYKRV